MKKYLKVFIFLLVLVLIPLKVNAATKTNFHLEVPTSNSIEYKNMVVSGWLMTNSNDPKIHMYIDNEELNVTINRFERNDVVRSNPGYTTNSNNQKPGFNTTVDTSKYSNGRHVLTINVLDYEKSEVLNQYSTVFYIEKSKTVLHLEKPIQNSKNKQSMIISGWLMSNNIDAKIEYYINREKIEPEIIRSKRPDVIKSMPGYGGEQTNPTPGFRTVLDLSNYNDGDYFLEVKIIDSKTNEILTGDSRNIKIIKYDSHINIDHPKVNEEVGTTTRFDGWYLSECENSKLEVYLDDTLLENEITRTAREDVLKAMNYSYGGKTTNPQPGFSTAIDTSEVTDGIHTIKLKVINSDTNEEISSATRQINVNKNKTVINIDHPVGTQKSSIRIDGWYLSANANNTIKIFIDDDEIESEITRTAREDVLKAMNYGYGGKTTNPKPGFSLQLNAREYLDGEHTIKVQILNSNDNTVLREETRKINIKKFDTYIHMDHPTTSSKENITVDGWYLSECKDSKVELFIDDTKIDKTFTYTAREDVLKAMNYSYGGSDTNPKPGYSATYSLKDYHDGNHKITIKVLDTITNEYIKDLTKTITLKKYDTFINIDNPKTDKEVNRNMLVTGWELSTDLDDDIKVLVDNNEMPTTINKSAREDVLKSMNYSYGGLDKNPNPGFNTTVDLTELRDGKHTITIQVVDTITGDVIGQKSTTFKLKKYDGKLHIENPQTSMINQDTLVIAGWEKSELDNSYVEIYIDNKKIDAQISRFERDDVVEGVQGYGTVLENPTPGFNTTIDISNLSLGSHKLTIKLYSKLNEYLTEDSKNLVKYNDLYFGIDVSTYNKTIDWSAVKNDGISFAFIRTGFRGYGTGSIVEDDKFKENITNALANNISCGVYFYSQAINENEAISEADFTVGKLQSYGVLERLKLPIVIDTEFTDVGIGRADSLSREQRTKVVKAFAERIRQHGYTPMIYASRDFLYFSLNMSELSAYDVWLAHYTSTDDPINHQSNYNGPYKVWQYTSTGRVNGISGNVDRNISYVKY